MNVIGTRALALQAMLVAALLFLSPGHAQAASVADAQKIDSGEAYDSRILLDPAQGSERQLAEAARVGKVAEAGDASAQYLLGTL